ncbi:hypothetical protein FCV25MIE_19648, partial [Fagus crenata]
CKHQPEAVLLGGWNRRHGQLFRRQILSRSVWATARRLGNAAVSRGVREMGWFEKIRIGNGGRRRRGGELEW